MNGCLAAFAGGGSISAILRRQSASVSCGPETNVPLTFVLYQPDTTPSQSDSSVLTWRGDRFCMVCIAFGCSLVVRKTAVRSTLVGEPVKVGKDGRDQIAMTGV